VLGHVRQGENEFVLDQRKQIQAWRTDDTLGIALLVGLIDLLGSFERGLGPHHLKCIASLHRQDKRLHASLAPDHEVGLRRHPQPCAAHRVGFTTDGPRNLGTRLLFGQVGNKARKAGNRHPAAHFPPKTRKLKTILNLRGAILPGGGHGIFTLPCFSSTRKTLDNNVFRHSQSNDSPPMRLILASSSPYRRDMLQRLGLPFTTVSPGVDETPAPEETPWELALRLAQAKAQAVAHNHPGSVVIGSDQVATFDGAPIGKPGNFERARAQLALLSGQAVEFHSALCVTDGTRTEAEDVVTVCRFRQLSDSEIVNYLRREQPYDTAGSAKAEGLGIALMESMQSGDPTAIIGLPLISLSGMLRRFGLDPLA